MKHKAFMARVYRQDERSNDNWSTILTRVPLDRPVVPETISNRSHLQNEFFFGNIEASDLLLRGP